jgi:hypothetical protein
MRYSIVITFGILQSFFASLLIAQEPATRAIDAVVVQYLSSGYSAADVVLDPNELVRDSSSRLRARRNLPRAQEVAGTLGTRTAERASVVTCGGRPRLCKLVGASMHLQLSVPEIRDSTATVVVLQHFTTGEARMPMAYRRLRLVLKRENGAWVVERQEIQVLS